MSIKSKNFGGILLAENSSCFPKVAQIFGKQVYSSKIEGKTSKFFFVPRGNLSCEQALRANKHTVLSSEKHKCFPIHSKLARKMTPGPAIP